MLGPEFPDVTHVLAPYSGPLRGRREGKGLRPLFLLSAANLATPCNTRVLNNYPSMYQEVWSGRYYQPSRMVILTTLLDKAAVR